MTVESSTPYSTLRYETGGGILTITLDRPERRNVFTFESFSELIDAFERADADDAIRVVVVTGSGDAFCAGADLDDGFVGEGIDLSPTLKRYLEKVGTIDGVPRDAGGVLSLTIASSRKPVIAAINGVAAGIGITMTLPMDVRVFADTARAGFVFTRRGLVPEAASSWFLPRVVGISRAMEWVATGRVFGADEALVAGLASHVVPADSVVEKALEIAAEIATHTSPVAVSTARHLMWSMLGADSPWDAHALDSRAIFHLAGRPDVHEGVTSFLEKRAANFRSVVSEDHPDFVPAWPERPERHAVDAEVSS